MLSDFVLDSPNEPSGKFSAGVCLKRVTQKWRDNINKFSDQIADIGSD